VSGLLISKAKPSNPMVSNLLILDSSLIAFVLVSISALRRNDSFISIHTSAPPQEDPDPAVHPKQ
jgi:hypothetical protein